MNQAKSISEATGLVRITKIPSGDAPESIRAAWVGLTLPCYPIVGYTEGLEIGALSGQPRAKKRNSVIVPQEEALRILEKQSPHAAKWWRDHGFPRAFTPNFSFGDDEVDFVSGVKYQKIIEVPDEAMGDPNR